MVSDFWQRIAVNLSKKNPVLTGKEKKASINLENAPDNFSKVGLTWSYACGQEVADYPLDEAGRKR